MRNLRNIKYSEWRPPVDSRSITTSAWDVASDSLIVAYGPDEKDALIELVRVSKDEESGEHKLITSWDAPCPNPDLSCDKILNLHYFGDTQTACLVLAGGDIVVVREDPLPGEDRIEIVGSVDAGITGARWSPDEELLAITTKENTLVFMSRSFEGIMDVTMSSEDLKASNHVSVGWGKKETQFQGRGAKALIDPTLPEKVDAGVLSPHDDGEVAITWRGDGAFVAVSSIEGGARRLIRVYSREGVLDSVTEPVDGLEGTLSWRPAGNLMAGIQRRSDRIDVVFFERNGLRHGEFSLRLTPEQMETSGKSIKLAWNSDSTVLAVILADGIQLWTMGNYHWYLKQHISMSKFGSTSLIWHPERPLVLMIAKDDIINSVEYVFNISRGSTAQPNDHGVVAVIDGKDLKLTPLRTVNAPPPIAAHEIETLLDVVDVAFNSDCSLMAVLHQFSASIYSWDSKKLGSVEPSLIGRATFDKQNAIESISQQIGFVDNENIVVMSPNIGAGSRLRYFGFDPESGRMEENTPEKDFAPSIYSLGSYQEGESARTFALSTSGELLDIHAKRFSLNPELPSFPQALPWVETIKHGEDILAFGLSSAGHLFANNRLLIRNCTSFLVTSAHLIFTTTTHLLKFVHLTRVEDLEISPDEPEKDERCRSIERGARLVTATPTSLSLVLQMPRGNLETIWPRAMVVAGIRKLIELKNYRKAFLHCRTQRVDMNILYDHAPEQFMSNVALFVDQIKKVTYIDLFLSSLREEDVTQIMYKETKAGPQPSPVPGVSGLATPVVAATIPALATGSKINLICDAVLEVLKTRQATNLQNIITANVCKSPPALEDGLMVVAGLMKENETLADQAVEHICFLSDVNKLYDNALGLYDLDLALLVAQQSQKDPREYLPFMQNLQQMSELRRRFSIDDYLGRNTKALQHLHDLDAFQELCNYTVKHVLYKASLSLYRYKTEQLNTLMALYASYLETQSNYREAGIAYEYLHDYNRATTNYQSASMWQEALFCASLQTPPLSQSAIQELATSLADALYEHKDYFNSATIYLDYNHDILNATRTFCKGYHFSTAMRIAALHNQPDLLTEVIDPGLAEALGSSTELLAECKAQLAAQVPRIRELRAKALADPLAFYEGQAQNEDIPDDISVAASSRISTAGGSLFTRYTGKQSIGTAGTGVSRATSKNRRREERKRARGKKGSVYEEEYLVNSVGRLIDRVESVREEISRLVHGLMRRGMRERAVAVETQLGEVVEACKACIGEVFGEEKKELKEGDEGFQTPGPDGVFQDAMAEQGRRKVAPVIGAFEKLSLLGA